MSSHGEEVPHDIVDGKETLDLRSRSEASPVAFALPCRLVRDFGQVIGVRVVSCTADGMTSRCAAR
jgi:hypothetical protein